MSSPRRPSSRNVRNRRFTRLLTAAIITAIAAGVSASYALNASAAEVPRMLLGLAGFGSAASNRASISEQAPPQTLPLADLAAARSGHTATLLTDGRVLVAGGDANGSAETYDPASDAFAAAGYMSAARSGHTATRLGNGTVLIAGGTVGGSAVATTEVFDPASGNFSNGPAMNAARSGHTAVTLADGRVVIIGGDAAGSIEIYDPAANSFSPFGATVAHPRSNHGAALLQNGSILVAGGAAPDGSFVHEGEIIDLTAGSVSAVSNIAADEHIRPLLRVLSDGKVQIIGGTDHADMEIYDPAINAFGAHSHVFPIGDSHPELVQQITDAPTRAALFYSGAASTLFDRTGETITEIPTFGKAIVIGGTSSGGNAVSSTALLNSSPASITTDKLDYAPGTPVVVTGTGFGPNETVTLTFHEDPHPDTENPHTFTVTTDANGNFTDQSYAPEDSDVGIAYVLAAVGGTSGYTAQTALTDGVTNNSVVITSPTPTSPTTLTSLPATLTVNFNYTLNGTVATNSSGTVQIQTAGGVVVASATSTTLPGGGNGPKSGSIPVTVPRATANGTYKVVVTVTNNGSDTGTSNNSVIINVPTATKLAFITPAFTATTGQCGSPTGLPITVQLQTAAGVRAALTGTTTVNLSSASGTGKFYSDSNCNTLITSRTILAGFDTAQFYYKDTSAGTPTITAASSGLTSATQSETINSVPATCGGVTFASQPTVTVGSGPEGGALADFNGDGKLDLAVANISSNTVSIRFGDGLGGFTGNTNLSVGTNPLDVTAGDFNGDGKPDIAVSNVNSNSVSVLINNGSGTFSTTATLPIGFRPEDLNLGDFNNDGISDLLVGAVDNGPPNIALLTGNGNGGFNPANNFSVGNATYRVAVGDFNSDGNLDFAYVTLSANRVGVAFGNGAGGFGAPVLYVVPNFPVAIDVGDFNNDGKLDIVSSSSNGVTSNEISILLNTGSGSFGAATGFAAGSDPRDIVIGDYNSDSNLDIAVANSAGNISVLVGNGSGNFASQPPFGSFANSSFMVSGDLNNDGKPDLVVPNTGSSTVNILLNSCLPSADLSITKSHTGNFTIGSAGSYTINVSNASGVSATTGTTTVTDSLPGNLTYTSFSGTGWSCSYSAPTVSCSFPGSIASGASANPLILNVSVGLGTPTGLNSITNTASVATAGDTNTANNSSSDPTTVNKANQSITFGSLADKSYGDADFSVSATASSALAVSFSASGSCTVTGSTVHIIGAGSCTITASQAGDANYNAAANVPQSFTVNKANATVAVTPYSTTYDGLPHTATYTITGVNGENGATVGTVDVSATTHTNAGTYNNDPWTFTGTGNYSNASGTVNDSIAKANAAVVVAPYTVVFDGSAHSASVTSITGVHGETGATVGTVDVSNTTHTNAGTYSADYWFFTGGSNYNNIGNTTITDKIDQAPSTTTITCGPGPFVYNGSAYTPCSATATGAGGLSVGVTVTYANNVLPGTAHADASYPGDTNHTSSVAAQVSFVIDKAGTTSTVVSSENPSFDGNEVTFNATVTKAQGTATPIGTVDFKDGSTVLGTVTLDASGHATFSTSTLSVATHPITAVYSGDSNYSGSTSAILDQVVSAAACVLPNAPGAWNSNASIAFNRGGLQAQDVSGTLYALGGSTGGCSGLQDLDAYDPSTNTWTSKAPMSTGRWHFATASTGGKLYAIGGAVGCGAGTVSVEAYDPATNTWSTKAPLPTAVARYGLRAVAVNGKIYAMGGQTDGPATVYAEVWEYDPVADAWTAKSPMPAGGRSHFGIGSINGKIYVAGGFDSAFQAPTSLLEYDPVADTWNTRASMSAGRIYPGAAVLDGKFYVYGGSNSGVTSLVEAYDPASDSWLPQPSMVAPRSEFGAAASGGRLYAVAGVNNSGYPGLSSVESYTPKLAGMVAWYPGNGNTNDVMGGNNGTLINGAGYAAGKVQQAFNFDGTDDYVSAPDTPDQHLVQQSIDAWIRPETTNNPFSGIVVKQNSDNTGRNYYLGIMGNQRLHYSIRAGGTFFSVNGNSAVPLNSWTHVAAVYDGDKMKIFINGQLDSELTVGSITPETTTSPLMIGWTNEADARYFDGGIDEVEIFNRALSASEIKSIFDASYKGKCNTAPVAADQNVTTNANTPVNITLSATDAEGNFLRYLANNGSLATTHGTLSVTNAAILTYTPAHDYVGPDSFTFVANDGFSDSAPATITIDVHCTGPTVDTDPVATTVTYGAASATFSAAAHGIPNPTVHWEVSTDNGASFVPVPNTANFSGQASPILSIADPTVGQSGSLYRAVFSSSCAEVTTAAAALTVNKATLTVTADDKSREYGDANPAFTASYSGFVLGQTLGTSGVSGSPGLTTAATPASAVGSYAITASAGTLASANYSFSFVDGTLTVSKATVNVKADDKSRDYGDANPAFTATYTGFKNSENFGTSSISGTPSLTTAAVAESPVGTYTITAAIGTLTSGNYTFTFTNGTLTVNKAKLEINAAAASKVYGDADPLPFSYTLSGFKNGEDAISAGVAGSASCSRAAGENVAGSPYAITCAVGSLTAANYYFAQGASANFLITPRPIRVKADDESKTYGDADPALTYQITSGSLAFTDVFTGYLARSAGENAGAYPIDQGTLALSSNYNLTFTAGTFTINKANLSVTANDQAITYGDADPTPFTFTYGTFKFSDTAAVIDTAPVCSVAGLHQNAGTYTIACSGGLDNNYDFSYANGTLTVEKRTATWTTNAASKTYGNADPSPLTTGSGSNFLAGDNITASYNRSPGETVAGGPYHITATLSATGDLNNYSITNVGADFTINARSLDITANNQSKFYGDAFNFAGTEFTTGTGQIVTGDSVASVTLTSTGSLATAAVGTYPIIASLATGTGLANYVITYHDGTLTVNKRAVTITADAKNKVYGENDPTLTYQITSGSLANGDAFTGSLTRASGESVGSYPILQGTVALSGNYDLSYVGAGLAITPRQVTVAADPQSKVYGDGDPALSYKITSGNLVTGDSFSGSLTREPGESVGTYAIHQGTLALSSNYTLTYVGANLTITQKAVSVTPDAAGKTYGGADPALTGTLSGFLAGDGVTASYSRAPGENVGSYTISAVLSPAGVLGNYNITYNTAAFTISKANLTVKADDASRTYGYANPAFTGVLAGVTNGDNITVSYSSAADTTSPIGTYPIVPSLIDPGSRLGNYNVTITNGTLTVTKRTLNVNANPQSKTYGDTFTFGGSEFTTGSGELINGDTVTSATISSAGAAAAAGVGGYPITISNAVGNGLGNYQIFYNNGTLTVNARPAVWTTNNSGKTYGDSDPSPLTTGSGSGFVTGDGVAATYGRAAGQNVGTYHITATLSATGDLNNYSITNVGADFVIAQRPASITANAKSKFYGDANPTLDAAVSGTAGSEVLNFTLSTAADNTSGVGSYPITVTLGSNPNYSITTTDSTLTINARAVTITADAKSKTYGDADPALTYKITAGSLANGDAFSGVLSRAAGENVGAYAIQQNTVALSSNYALTYVGADLTIGKRNAAWTTDPKTKVYGNDDPTFTGSGSGFVLADGVTASYNRIAGEFVAGGPYHITATLSSSVTGALDNYNITNAGADLAITLRQLDITAIDKSKIFNTVFTFAGNEFGVGPGQLVAGDGVSSVSLTSTGTPASAAVGTYPIVAGNAVGTGLENYHIDYHNGTMSVTNVAVSNVTVTGAVINEYDTATLTVKFDDPDAGQTHNGTINWGDGSSQPLGPFAPGITCFQVSHQYRNDRPTLNPTDTNNVLVTISDGTPSASGGSTVTINNVAPTIASITGAPTAPVQINTPVSLTVNFADVGKQDSHKCAFNWDDTTPSTYVSGTVNETIGTGVGTCTGTKTFSTPGVYTVMTSVTDDDTGTVTRGLDSQYIVVFDPNGGFVTGGGWIMSPAGASTQFPTATGKANFGFVSKYKKGSNTPDGQTEFQFQAGNLNFHSSSYDVGSLVVSGYKAQYKGVGDINGVPGYKFILTAYDGDINGAGNDGLDKFRIKILDSNNNVVYDNRMNASDDIDFVPMAISGGSINIQKPGK